MAAKASRMKRFREEERMEREKESVLLSVEEERIGCINIKKREQGNVAFVRY